MKFENKALKGCGYNYVDLKVDLYNVSCDL